ncbi:hypothetical protein D9M71_170100 [compost metagenome]
MHIHRAQRISSKAATLSRRLRGEQLGKGQHADGQLSRLAGVMSDTGKPPQCFAHRCEAIDQARLADRYAAVTVSDVIAHFLSRGAGIGGDSNRPQLGARTPGQEKFRAVFQMDKHPIAAAHAKRFHGGGNRPDSMVELSVRKGLGRTVKGFPDQQWLVAVSLGLGCQQPVEILTGERIAGLMRGHTNSLVCCF